MEAQIFEDVYYLLNNKGYKVYFNCDTLIAFNDATIFVDDLLKAMTISTLSIAGIYESDRITHELLHAERTIGKLFRDFSNQNEFYQNNAHFDALNLWLSLSDIHHDNYQEAAIRLQNIIQKKQAHWRFYWYLGQALYKLGSLEAEKCMVKVIQAAPHFQGILEFKKNINA